MTKPRLVAISGPWAGTVWLIPPKGLRIGRDPEKNNVCLDDATVSGEHAFFEIVDGQMFVHDQGTSNGIVVNDIGYLDRAVHHGDIIELGISTVIYLEHNDDPDALPVIVHDETDKTRKMATLRVDRSSRGDEAIYQKSVRRVLGEICRILPTMPELEAFLNRVIDLTFVVVHGRRGVIMLNGRHKGTRAEDFEIRVWRERDVPGQSPFTVSGSIIDEVYATGKSVLSNSITPVICVPILLGDTVVGVFYLEGRVDVPFDWDQLECVEYIAADIATSLLLSKIVDRVDRDYERLRAAIAPDFRMIGSSDRMKDMYAKITKAARHDLPVLITGETGTGKELVARLIHALSPRKDKACITVNCGGIPKDLVEGELYGHVKGGFTGAVKDRKGAFEEADDGTIFLDEIGDMPLDAQVKVLRVVEYGDVRPVGGESKDTKKVNVRVIAATRVDLNAAMESGQFRDDLFERLNGVQIRLPALRERPEDVQELVDYFIQQYGTEEGVTGITDEALQALKTYHWPRNIRQLKNAVRQAVVLREATGADNHLIRVEDLPEWVFDDPPVHLATGPSRIPITKPVLERALHETSWNVKAAAGRLNRSVGHIYDLMNKYRLPKRQSDSD